MAKRKEVKRIVIEERIVKEVLPPKCFGNKEDYCVEEYCGEWFEKCIRKEEDNEIGVE
jgi:hypothetical protein